jgi:alpha,alpha-trehalase
MIKLLYFIIFLFIPFGIYSQQTVASPAQLYGDLFREVQMARIFPDSKQFANAEPRQLPQEIFNKYIQLRDLVNKNLPRRLKNKELPKDVLQRFVTEHFDFPRLMNDSALIGDTSVNLELYAKNLLKSLTCSTISVKPGSSLIALPYPYIACGNYFNEMHYWDSYFIMLGLKASGQHEMLENMVNNFAYLIDQFGHIPATNRTYSIGNSQPPFFSLMIDLLADVKGNSVYTKFLPQLEKEYLFWMEGADSIKRNSSYKRVVKFNDGTVLNRYGNGTEAPREEFYGEDVLFAEKIERSKKDYWVNMRAATESGWFLSSRWLKDIQKAESVEAATLLPVDLNSLLLHLECTLRDIYRGKGETNKVLFYAERILNREVKLDFLFWNKEIGFYCDYDIQKKQVSDKVTLAGMFPLLFKERYREIERERIELIVEVLQRQLLFEGGACNTVQRAAQPFWDSPYGSAPLQWALITSLENYGYHSLAKETALNWVNLTLEVYSQTGRLQKHYDVMNPLLQYNKETMPLDDIATNNGLFLYLINIYNMHRSTEKVKEVTK